MSIDNSTTKPVPNLPPGFDFTDPDIHAVRLPVEELAELRRTAPIWWNEQPDGCGGFDDGGFWVISKHKDVKEVSLRSDVFSSLENTALPRYREGTVREQRETGKFVLLNMDAPQHTHLRKIISRGFTPPRRRAVARRPQRACSADRRGRRGRRVRRFRRAGVVRVAAASHRRTVGRAARGADEAVPLVQPDGGRPGSRVRPQRCDGRLGRADHLRHADGRRPGEKPWGGHCHQADPGGRRRPQALRGRVRFLRHPAGRGRQ